jgi:hypothetical protein
MNENRRRILDMLAENKITAEEAERLLSALDGSSGPDRRESPEFSASRTNTAERPTGSKAKYLRVLVMAEDNHQGSNIPTTVNIRVPMQLLRAGVRLASLIPVQAHEHLDEALSRHGVPLTLSQIKPENLEELIDHLDDLSVDVDTRDKMANVKVQVFSE